MSFASDTAAILAGPLGDDAIYTRSGGDPVAVRVMRSRPDRDVAFGDARLRMPTAVFVIAVAQVAVRPNEGDTIVCGGETYVVQGTPSRDERHLRWSVEARPA